MDYELEMDLSTKYILHWNCRGFTQLPDALRTHGRKVQEIYLKWNNLTVLPSWLAALSSLTNLYLPYNLLESLPDEIVHLVSLKVVDISHNRLKELPPSIGRLSGLVVLVINNNQLKSLPEELCMLKLLQTLEASSNVLRALPSRLDKCVSLREIVVDNNQLASLPNTIVYLFELTVLCINNNYLRYLPAVPFACPPYLRFNDNAHLSYIPYQLGRQLTDQSDIKIVGDLWDLKCYGCFTALPVSAIQRPNLSTEQIISYGNNHIVLPPPLRIAVSSLQTEIAPLRELALRAAYELGYEHLRIRRPKRPHLFRVLPHMLQQQLLEGPAAICQLNCCRRPLFEFAAVWVVPTCSISHNREGITSLLAVLFFCSVSCSRRFAQCETALNARQVSWNVLSEVS